MDSARTAASCCKWCRRTSSAPGQPALVKILSRHATMSSSLTVLDVNSDSCICFILSANLIIFIRQCHTVWMTSWLKSLTSICGREGSLSKGDTGHLGNIGVDFLDTASRGGCTCAPMMRPPEEETKIWPATTSRQRALPPLRSSRCAWCVRLCTSHTVSVPVEVREHTASSLDGLMDTVFPTSGRMRSSWAMVDRENACSDVLVPVHTTSSYGRMVVILILHCSIAWFVIKLALEITRGLPPPCMRMIYRPVPMKSSSP
mmetsp:Transcript_15954/g.40909  ORF Transcript_15954/g.40909 Transcript_15954/m.40909 type:complete len:260 (+) Transcript_15954:289-1068(+)